MHRRIGSYGQIGLYAIIGLSTVADNRNNGVDIADRLLAADRPIH